MSNWTRTQAISGVVDIWSVPDLVGQTDGNPVSSLMGLTSGIVLSQATAGKQPTFVASWANAKPGLSFDGVDDFLQSAWQSALAPSAFTLFVVADGGGSGTGLLSNRGTSNHGYGVYTATSNVQISGYVGFNGTGSTSMKSAGPFVFTFDSTSSAQHTFINGSADATGANSYVPSANGPLNFGGYAGANSGSYWPGHGGALILFNRVLTAAERAQVHSDIQDLFGITVSDYVSSATVPGAPTGVTAVAGDGDAIVSWTAPVSDGGSTVTSYTVTASPGGAQLSTANGSTTSLDFTGLTNGTAYTFTVHATNAIGNSAESAASNSVTPTASSFTGTGAFSAPAGGAAGAGTFTPPSFNGTGTVSAPAGGASGSGTFVAPSFTGTGAVSAPRPTVAGSGTFTGNAVSGTGTLDAPSPTVTGSGSFIPAAITGTGALTAPAATTAGVGDFSATTITGTGVADAAAAWLVGVGVFHAPATAGTGGRATVTSSSGTRVSIGQRPGNRVRVESSGGNRVRVEKVSA